MVFEASLTWLKAGAARILSFSSTFHIYMMSNINHVAQPSLLISGKSSILFISSICRRVLLLDTALQSLYTHADPHYNILNRFVSSVLSDADGTLNNNEGYQGLFGVALSQAPSMFHLDEVYKHSNLVKRLLLYYGTKGFFIIYRIEIIMLLTPT